MSGAGGISQIAIVGAGLIGTSWASVFARAGLAVRVFDADRATREAAPERIAANLAMLEQAGLSDPAQSSGEVRVCDALEQAVTGADYVQESVLETPEVKRVVCARIDAVIGERTIVGSSSSGIPASAFTGDLTNRARFFIVHPVNPPHLIPLVEIVPAPWSDTAHIDTLRAFLTELGQEPIVVTREIEGFVLNRLQGALLNEALALYADGYASLEDIDRTVRAGLGLRWSLMGPFQTIDLNAPGGIADYAGRFAPLYRQIAQSRRQMQPWPDDAIVRAAQELAQSSRLHNRDEQMRKRDEWLITLKQAKLDRR